MCNERATPIGSQRAPDLLGDDRPSNDPLNRSLSSRRTHVQPPGRRIAPADRASQRLRAHGRTLGATEESCRREPETNETPCRPRCSSHETALDALVGTDYSPAWSGGGDDSAVVRAHGRRVRVADGIADTPAGEGVEHAPAEEIGGAAEGGVARWEKRGHGGGLRLTKRLPGGSEQFDSYCDRAAAASSLNRRSGRIAERIVQQRARPAPPALKRG